MRDFGALKIDEILKPVVAVDDAAVQS